MTKNNKLNNQEELFTRDCKLINWLYTIYTIYTIFYTKPHFYFHETSGNGVKRLNKSPFIGDKIYKMELSREWTISSRR